MRARSILSLLALPALTLIVLSTNSASATELAGCDVANGWDPRQQGCIMTVADGKPGDPFARGGSPKPAGVGSPVRTGGGSPKPAGVGSPVPTSGGAPKPVGVGGPVPTSGGAPKPAGVGGPVRTGGGSPKPVGIGGPVPTGGAKKPVAGGGAKKL